jgi:hypothetical protein
VAGVFGGSLFSAMHGSLVTSSLLAESGGDVSLNAGYNFGQVGETYSISAAHGYFGRLILGAWPVILSPKGKPIFNQSIIDSTKNSFCYCSWPTILAQYL